MARTTYYERAQLRTDTGLFHDKTNQCSNVLHEDFEGGAWGDGDRDDTRAVQAALNFAVPLGIPVYFPYGVYKITAPLIIPDIVNNKKNHIIIQGAGAPDLLYDGNPDPPEEGGSVILYTPTDGSHCLSYTASPLPAASAVSAITLRDIQIRHATESTSSGDGLRILGDQANARQVRLALHNLAVRGFKGGSGVYTFFCQNGSAFNLTCCRNKYGLKVDTTGNANSFYNYVGQFNTHNAVWIKDVVGVHFFGGLIQSNLRNGVYVNGGECCSFNGVYFENNSTESPGTYHAVHLQGTTGKFNSRIKFDTCNFATESAGDSIRLEGVSGGGTDGTTFICCRSRVITGNSITMADAFVSNTTFVTVLGGSVGDSGTGTNTLD